MDNIYNAIQNLYNMDKTTWQEVLAELYNLVSKIDNKFDLFEVKFGQLLGEQVTRELKKMYDDGSLASLINDKLLKDINIKVDTFKTEVSEQLDTKANESEVNKRLRFRNFKPKFGYNCYWGEIWGTDGTHTQKNRIEIDNDIKQCEELGIDEITVDIHVGYNSNTSALYIATNMDDVLWAIEKCASLNVKIKNAKIHVGILEDYLNNITCFLTFIQIYSF